jgi:F-type H+-transporting ATPase subunit delta
MSVAKAYAKALFEAATEAQPSGDGLAALEFNMDVFEKTLKSSPQLRAALTGPVASVKEKSGIIDALAAQGNYSKLFRQFLTLMARKGRLDLFSKVCESFAIVKLEAEGGTLGKLETAEPIEASDIEGLAAAFSKKLGKKVAFRASTEPALLAGMKVTVNGVTYDGSLASQLRRLRDAFVYGNDTVSH